MKRRQVIVAGGGAIAALPLAGCMKMGTRGSEEPPAVNAVHFRNHHDEPHEATVAFEKGTETLFSHTESLPAKTGEEAPTATIRPDVPRTDWTVRASLAESDRERLVWQARIEYTRVDVLCRITPGGMLDLRVRNAG